MTDVERVALEPCPFCGGKPIYHAHRIAEDAMAAFVSCSKCGCQTEYFEDAYAPRAQAITAWNTRAALSAMPSGNEVREAWNNFLPRNLCLTNANVSDDTVVPLECTMGELRQITDLLAKLAPPQETTDER